MDEDERRAYLVGLDDELLQGGVMLSEWTVFLTRDADMAFAAGANLAALVVALSGVETHLRWEYGEKAKGSLAPLIAESPVPAELQRELDELRRYRNTWVHVNDPDGDGALLSNPDERDRELEEMAMRAMRALRQTLYLEPSV